MSIAFALIPAPPFRLELAVWTLRRRPSNAIDRWDGATYRRAILLNDTPVEIAVRQTAPPNTPRLQVVVSGKRADAETKLAATQALERLLGIRSDLENFYRLAARDAQLKPLAKRFRGMKPPRFPTLFEALVNAIACQQVTLTLGILLLNRLADNFGAAVQSENASVRAFPRPHDLARASPHDLRRLGFSYNKAHALIELSRAVMRGQLNEAQLSRLPDDAVIEGLREYRGVGRWTAEYVLLRGLGRVNIFPGDDVGARNNLQRWLKRRAPMDYARVRRIVTQWEPYAGLIYFHLLLDRLAEKGYVKVPA